jgi:hypothetical protein
MVETPKKGEEEMTGKLCFAVALLIVGAGGAGAQQQAAGCPMHEKHQSTQDAQTAAKAGDNRAPAREEMSGMSEMNARGDKAMGFSQEKTTHHFRLFGDGGAIEVEVKDAQDASSRGEIRQHLAHITRAFASGDFNLPMFIHDQVPPGVPAMKRLKAEISYEFEKTVSGARVRIKTNNAEALAAVHDFLRFQIKEHQTGDALEAR